MRRSDKDALADRCGRDVPLQDIRGMSSSSVNEAMKTEGCQRGAQFRLSHLLVGYHQAAVPTLDYGAKHMLA